MKDKSISEIYKSKDSSSYYYFLESKKIQENYWKKFVEEFDRLIVQNKEELREEEKSFIKIKEMMESEVFQYLLDNDKYREKLDIIFSKEKFMIGKCNTKLLKIYQEILVLRDNYEKEYESYITEAGKKMRMDLVKFDVDSKIMLETIFNTRVCTESFFNTLCNNKII